MVCLEAFKCVLPAPLVVQAHLACYASAQPPYSQDNGAEWNWFSHCMLDLMGYLPDDKAKVRAITIIKWQYSKAQLLVLMLQMNKIDQRLYVQSNFCMMVALFKKFIYIPIGV